MKKKIIISKTIVFGYGVGHGTDETKIILFNKLRGW